MANTKKAAVTGFSAILVVLLGIAIFFYFSFTTVVVTGNSMEPTFENGDRLLASSAYWLVGPIKKKDIVVVRSQQGGYFIKRVYGLGGDVIDYMNVPDNWRLSQGEYRVPEGHVFVVGDNREVSEDSRRFGPVPVGDVLGKIVVRR